MNWSAGKADLKWGSFSKVTKGYSISKERCLPICTPNNQQKKFTFFMFIIMILNWPGSILDQENYAFNFSDGRAYKQSDLQAWYKI